jgi:hypothetical protein
LNKIIKIEVRYILTDFLLDILWLKFGQTTEWEVPVGKKETPQEESWRYREEI